MKEVAEQHDLKHPSSYYNLNDRFIELLKSGGEVSVTYSTDLEKFIVLVKQGENELDWKFSDEEIRGIAKDSSGVVGLILTGAFITLLEKHDERTVPETTS